jgi:hypothetical protein
VDEGSLSFLSKGMSFDPPKPSVVYFIKIYFSKLIAAQRFVAIV